MPKIAGLTLAAKFICQRFKQKKSEHDEYIKHLE